ncbi:MAG: hypothetical protein P8K09_01420 [Hyphomicrobiales bacterium]|nr:hypothetical protein [Hyphomicrobiales bacterium]
MSILIRIFSYILFLSLIIHSSIQVHSQPLIKKYINAELLVFNKLTQERIILKIPTKSSRYYRNLNIHVNSCFKMMDDDQDFISNISLEFIYMDRIEKSENIALYTRKQFFNTETKDPSYEFKLLRCNNKDDLIINDIYKD